MDDKYPELPTPRIVGRYAGQGVEKDGYDAVQMRAYVDADRATMRESLIGMSVSVDVSTGEHDAGNRYFGKISEVMECDGEKGGLMLLVQDAEANFEVAAYTQDAQDAARYRWLRMQHWDNAEMCVVTMPKRDLKLGAYCPSMEGLDRYIDEAMAEIAKEKRQQEPKTSKARGL